jgi:hypothetical protein
LLWRGNDADLLYGAQHTQAMKLAWMSVFSSYILGVLSASLRKKGNEQMDGHQHNWEYFTSPQGQWARRCLDTGCERVEVSRDDLNLDWEARAKALEEELAEAVALLRRGSALIAEVLDETDDAHLSRVNPKALSAWQKAYAVFLAQRQK